MLWLEQLVEGHPVVASFVGASLATCIPLIFNLIKEVAFDRRKRKEERVYISVQLIFILENFVMKCADISWDRGYNPEYPEEGYDDGRLTDQVKIEDFDMSSVKGEYKYLKPKLLYDLQSINIKIHQAKIQLSRLRDESWHTLGPDWEYYETRRKLFAAVGQDVADIAKKLRKEFDIKRVRGWNPERRIYRSLKNIKEEKEERKKASEERDERKRLREMENSDS